MMSISISIPKHFAIIYNYLQTKLTNYFLLISSKLDQNLLTKKLVMWLEKYFVVYLFVVVTVVVTVVV